MAKNPLEVTKRIKDKIRELQKGLPEGVKIVPFYDRTRLIEGAIETVRRVLEHEMLIAALAILLILVHLRSVFVVVITLPLSIIFSFILMCYFGISSNIMSLSGIAISIGILVDQAVVMVENATHELTKKFGDQKITGDTTEISVKACRQVGRPIFFSVMIMIVSFLPVFALSGQEGKMFHPLAFTKSFALIGTALLSITLVPALMPIMIRGRLAREDKNWIVRSVTGIYRPTLGFLMGKPKTVIFLFVLLLAFGFYLARHLGREFMPPLDEGSILDMPVTVPRLSVTQAADDLKARDAMIRQFPEVELVVGKSGRADTPTDPSPLDMVESIITLRPRDHWLKRKMHEKDAIKESDRVIGLLANKAFLTKNPNDTERRQFAELVSSMTQEKFDEKMREKYSRMVNEFDERMGQAQAWFVGEKLLDQIDGHKGWSKPFSAHDRRKFLNEFSRKHKAKFTDAVMVYEVEEGVATGMDELEKQGLLRTDPATLLAPIPSKWNLAVEAVKGYAGMGSEDFNAKLATNLENFRDDRTRQWVKLTNQSAYDGNIGLFEATLFETIQSEAKIKGWWNDRSDPKQLAQVQKDSAIWFRDHTFLWPLTKAELVRELDSGVRQLGWANIWTQPIINRVDMLATGVRTQLGIQVFGKSPDDIQRVSNDVASVLKEIPGAVDVVPDQTVGKGYVEINIDRERAARYGVRVGDIQDVIEIALGGKPITKSIEGRERYPIRLRYARDFREDEESIRNLLIAAQASAPSIGDSMSSSAPSAEASAISPSVSASTGLAALPGNTVPQVHLGDLAEIKIVEGPVMIKSENGLLRSYVQLNVRDRDIVGFVEEAQRVVAAKVKLPQGSYLGWTGQFEHQVRAKKTLRLVFPAVIAVIFLILFLTYHDFMHALLMMLAVPGALAGGVMFQTLLGYNFSVAVWVGYIACFGMATETGIIMLVYLRAAIEDLGGLRTIPNLKTLEEAVMTGAVHRLRPKLLTEGTAIVGLAPMLWAHGVGAEVIAPMAAPVLGGLLIADEVIDIFLPVLFYHLEARRWKKLHMRNDVNQVEIKEGQST